MKTEENKVQEEAAGLIFAGEKGFFYSYNIIFDLELSEHAKILYLYLCRRADGNSRTFPSYQTMASACSLSRSTAIRAMKELMAEGLLLRKHQQHGKEFTSNQYLLYAAPDEEAKRINLAQMEEDKEAVRKKRELRTKKESEQKCEGIRKKELMQKLSADKKTKTEKPIRNFSKKIGRTGVTFRYPEELLIGQMEMEDLEADSQEGRKKEPRGSPL